MKRNMNFSFRIPLAVMMLFSGMAASAEARTEVLHKSVPAGWVLTVTSVCVVFFALIILYFIYSFAGKLFSGEIKLRKPASGRKMSGMSPETAAAIAIALEKENNSEVNAAIALALHRYLNETVHDSESYRLTLKPTFGPYASRHFTLRQLPERKK